MLTLEEKIGQLMLVGFDGTSAPAHILDWLARGRVGGVYLFARNIESPAQVKRLVAECRAAAKTPILVGIDQEGGIVARLRAGFSESPGAMALGAARDPQLAEDIAAMMGREMAALGINWTFAPVADIAHRPGNPSVSTRSVGRDKQLVSEMVTAQLRGFQRAGIAATVKHFPGLGNTILDTHDALARVSGSLDYLYAEDLIPFREAIKQDVACVMITHVLYEDLDSQYPATLSPRIVERLLRGELGYDGAVCSDCMEMKAITDGFGAGESAVLALLAGVDMPLFSHSRARQEAAFEAALMAAQSGRIPAHRIDSAVQRVKALKRRFPLEAAPALDCVASAAHTKLAERAARAGIALLQRGAGLPIRPDAAHGNIVAVEFNALPISDAVDSGASSAFANALSHRLPQARCMQLDAQSTLPAALAAALEAADTVILLTRNAHMQPPQAQLAREILARARQSILICARNPYDAGLLQQADTILCTHGDSRPSLVAAVAALCGDFLPSGELTVPLP